MSPVGWGCRLGSSPNTLSLFCGVLGFERRFPVSSPRFAAAAAVAVTAGSAAPWLPRGTGLTLREAMTGKGHTSPLHLRKHPLQSTMGPSDVACNGVEGREACRRGTGGSVHAVWWGWLVAHAVARHRLGDRAISQPRSL